MSDPNAHSMKSNILNQVRIVLVNTSDCRNIGSAARAMKTMGGLSQLILVDPIEMPNVKLKPSPLVQPMYLPMLRC